MGTGEMRSGSGSSSWGVTIIMGTSVSSTLTLPGTSGLGARSDRLVAEDRLVLGLSTGLDVAELSSSTGSDAIAKLSSPTGSDAVAKLSSSTGSDAFEGCSTGPDASTGSAVVSTGTDASSCGSVVITAIPF